MTSVTRRYKFAASHRLHSAEFTAAQNAELYGKCNNPHGHGHDYVLEVTATGPVDSTTGQVVNIQTLDALVRDQVLRDFDHRYLNADVPEFGQHIPTSENIIRVIEQRLQKEWPRVFSGPSPRLDRVHLQETRRNSFASKVQKA